MPDCSKPPPPPNAIIELRNECFRLGIAPALGGSITHLAWRPPGGPEVALLRAGTLEDVIAGQSSRLASFVMLPFTNRIDGGRIPLATGGAVQVPVNRATQNVAIHGFGRTAGWQIIKQTTDDIVLQQSFAEPANPFAYSARQRFTLQADQVVCSVEVTNTGNRAMPFGIGFHPWFDRTAQATLELEALHVFRMDARDMPLEALPLGALFDAARGTGRHRMRVAQRTPFDTPVSGWQGQAVITWPEWGTQLNLHAGGALRLVHIFSPTTPAVFCVEPVSHLPDVVNRRWLAAHGEMTMLAPRATLAGAMRLVPARQAGK